MRAWTLLAIFVLLSTMFAWSAIAAKPVLADSGVASPDHSTITVSAPTSSVDDSVTVTVTAIDDQDVPLTTYTDTVTISSDLDGALTVTNNNNGTYSATLSDTALRTHTLSATINTDTITTGDPTVEFTPGAVTQFDVSTTGPYAAGSGFGVTVTALDQYGHTNPDYNGTATLSGDLGTSSMGCPGACSPDYGALTAFSDGSATGTVTPYVKETGRTVTATDDADSNITGTSDPFAVGAGSLVSTILTPDPSTQNADDRDVSFTATGYDAYGNEIGDVTDDVAFGIDGVDSSCSANVCGSNKTGDYTVSDTTTNTGTAALTITPGDLAYFTIDTISGTTAGAPVTITVHAFDAHDNIKTDYTGGTLSDLDTSPGCTGCSPMLAAKPAYYGTLTWNEGVGTATIKAYAADATSHIKITDGAVSEVSNDFVVDNAATLAGFDLQSITDKVAGTGFTAYVTAYDSYGNVLDTYTNVAAHLTGLNASPGCTTCGNSLPVTPATYGGPLVWSGGSTSTTVTPYKAEASTLTVTDGSISNSSTFTVDDKGTLGAFDLDPIGGQTAGTGFGITATAYDPYGNVYDAFAGASTTLSGLNASPGCSICGNVLSSAPADYGTLSWTGGVGTSTITAYKAESATLTVGNGTKSDSSSFTVDYKHTLAGLSIADITGTKTAGVSFVATVTAYDEYGNVKKDHGSVTLSGLAASPGCTAADCGSAIAAGTATYLPVTGTGWSNGVYTANVTAKKSQILASVMAADGSINDTSTTFTVNPSTAAKLLFSDSAIGFNGRPIDTKLNQPIYSVCTPPGVSGNPCGVPPASTGTKVVAIDQFGNRVSGVSVTITKTAGGGTLTGGAATSTAGGTQGVAPYGEATFNLLKNSALGAITLKAAVGSNTTPTPALTDIRIVDDLEACDGTSCDNLASNTQVKSYGQIGTGSDFFDTSLQTNVILDTAIVPASDFTGKCGSGASVFGSGADIRIQGAGLVTTAPTTTMIIVVPKDTLKKLGITARSASSFNVCLGALWIDAAHSPTAWKVQGGGNAIVRDPSTDPLRYWGIPAMCGTPNLPASSPCVGIKTKQVADMAAYLHMTTTAVKQFMNDSDVGIVIRKPFPWDGKGGLF